MRTGPISFAVAVFLALAIGQAVPAAAREFKAGGLTVHHPWARPSIGNLPNGAGYMTLKNTGAKDDLLEAVSSPVAGKAEVHTHIKDGNVMRMRPVEGGVAVPANGEATFAPGGLHVMFLGLNRKLEEGDTFPMTLKFRDAGEVEVEVTVEKPGAKAAGGHKHHH